MQSTSDAPPGSEAAPYGDVEVPEQHVLFVTIFDQPEKATTLTINRKITGKDVCLGIVSMIDIPRQNTQFYSLVLVVTVADAQKKYNTFCVRTIQNSEEVLIVMDTFLVKMMERFGIADFLKLKTSVRWFFKDARSSPMALGEGDMVGEYDSDDEEDISHSDLAYLTSKSDRKGYLLKRSHRDPNLWRRWYCILTDHLWCINVSSAMSKAVCVKLTGVVKQRDVSPASQQVQTIVITSPKRTHLLRVLRIEEQKKWVEEINARTMHGGDNEIFQMAEVITSDEENSRSQRFHSPLERLLSIQSVYERTMTDYRRSEHLSTALTAWKGMRADRPAFQYSDRGSDVDEDEGDELVRRGSSGDADSDDENSAKAVANSSNTPKALSRKSPVPCIGAVTPVIPHHAAVRRLIHPQDRSRQTPAVHRLHGYEPELAKIFKYVVDVMLYKEAFRHDLFVAPARRRQVALTIFSEHLFPQLHLADDRSNPLDESFNGVSNWGMDSNTLRDIQQKLFATEPAVPSSVSSLAASWESSKGSPMKPEYGTGSSFWSLLAAGSKQAGRNDSMLGRQGADSPQGDHVGISNSELFDETIEEIIRSLESMGSGV